MPNYLFTIVDNALNISHYEIVQEYLIDIIKVILRKSSKLRVIPIMRVTELYFQSTEYS